MMKSMLVLLPAFAVVLLLNSRPCSSTRELAAEYASTTTLHESYELFWSYDLDAETISFAVRVRTEGWVGFGLSPNGQMPGSDVVIGWVDEEGKVFFHDRFAEGKFTPAIDESQDWIVEFGEQENGYTILGFRRSLTTCDPKDLDILAETSRVVWSWHSSDPASPDSVMKHEYKGSTSVNLLQLGGLGNPPPQPSDSDSFTITNNNVTIPSDKDTTYWCSAHRLPPEIREQTRYIYKFAPYITEGNIAFVHHVLIYLCLELDHAVVGQGTECDSAHADIKECQGSYLIAGWGVGGNEFAFPEDVAVALGGPGTREYIVLEMHFDNPSLQSGVIDSSGVKFFYSNIEPEHKAGLLMIGSNILSSMVIPPNTDNYLIEGFCSEQCTKQFFPPDGIMVFANILHTHTFGHGLRVKHFRQNEECGVTEELAPVDENLRYDFDFQQFNHLPRMVKVMPGDSLVVQCFYDTTRVSKPVLGGPSTQDEMCLSFLYYYPRVDLSFCTSTPRPPHSFTSFTDNYIDQDQREHLLNSLNESNATEFFPILEAVDWTPEAIDSFKDSILSKPQVPYCYSDVAGTTSYLESIPRSECPYEAPDSCSRSQPQSCCERVLSDITDGGATTSTSLLSLAMALTIMYTLLQLL